MQYSIHTSAGLVWPTSIVIVPTRDALHLLESNVTRDEVKVKLKLVNLTETIATLQLESVAALQCIETVHERMPRFADIEQ